MKIKVNFLLIKGIYSINIILSNSSFKAPIIGFTFLMSLALKGIKKLIEKFSNNNEFIKENKIIFELIQMKMEKKIIKNFEYKIPKEKIIVYSDENFEDIIKEIKNILLKKNIWKA